MSRSELFVVVVIIATTWGAGSSPRQRESEAKTPLVRASENRQFFRTPTLSFLILTNSNHLIFLLLLFKSCVTNLLLCCNFSRERVLMCTKPAEAAAAARFSCQPHTHCSEVLYQARARCVAAAVVVVRLAFSLKHDTAAVTTPARPRVQPGLRCFVFV